MINKDLIYRKIKLIHENLSHLEPFAHLSFDELEKDRIGYAATEMQLERIVTRATSMNRHIIGEIGSGLEKVTTYQDTFLALAKLNVYPEQFAKQIAPSAGLRIIYAYDDEQLDPKEIYPTVGKVLEQYAKYCNYLLKLMDIKQNLTFHFGVQAPAFRRLFSCSTQHVKILLC